MKIRTLDEQKQEVLMLMKYSVPEEQLAEAVTLVEKYAAENYLTDCRYL